MPNFQLPHHESFKVKGSQDSHPAEYVVPEIDTLESFQPVIDEDVKQAKSLTVRGPRQVEFLSLVITSGQVVQLVGFDAQRDTVTISDTDGLVFLAANSSAFDNFSDTAAFGAYAQLLSTPTVLHCQTPIYAYCRQSDTSVKVSIIVERL